MGKLDLPRALRSVVFAQSLERRIEGSPQLCLEELRGRLSEFSTQGGGVLSLGVHLLLEAQQAQQWCAWIDLGASFFPPDVARAGVDLAALPVVHAPTGVQALGAAGRLLSSGSFALVVVDLVGGEGLNAHGTQVALHRLGGLAQTHEAALVLLTSKSSEAPSMDSLISLRGAVYRGEALGGGRHRLVVEILKDKRRGPSWRAVFMLAGPEGVW